jgi:pimeloyl-ACP methyl ester carboxylesterase
MSVRQAFSRVIPAWAGLLTCAAAGLADPPAAAPAPPAAAPAAKAPAKAAKPEELVLETSDGLELHAWYYTPLLEEEETTAATVILLHDLEGSHTSVEPLALALQAAGCGVVAPDLRGHGASTSRGGAALDVRTLKKPDFELMAAARGGQRREQSAVRGDVEAVRNWIKAQSENHSEDGKLDMQRLFVVGSGLGATVAAAWAAEDANWPDGTKGPQGRQVRGLVLLSPAWTTRGFSINAPLANPAVKQDIPLMVIAGQNDGDAGKVFEQLKRQRPSGWFQQQADGGKDKAAKLEDPTKASLFFFEFDSTRTADALAADRTLNPAAVIGKFFKMALDRPRR